MLLRSMRKGFFSALFLALLVLGGVSLVFTDWNGMFKGGTSKTDVAKVDGTPIKISEFNSRVTRVLHSQQVSADAAYQMGLINNILMQDILAILMKKDAASLGIRIEDRIIAEQIKATIAPYKKDGESDKDTLKRVLEMQGLNEKMLIASMRDELTSKILQSTLATANTAPRALIDDLYAAQHQSRTVELAFFPNAAVTLSTAPSDKDLESYYQTIAAGYMVPETRDITLAYLDTSKIAKTKASDTDVKTAYDENASRYNLPESATIEQSLISDAAKAKAVAEAVKAGQKMDAAVMSATGDKKAYAGETSLTKDGLPEDIATPVFTGKAGDVIGPVKSALGYHVIKLVKITPAHPADFDSVKEKIRKELNDEKAGNAIFDVTNAIEDRLANGEKFETIAQQYPLTLVSLPRMRKDSKAPKEYTHDAESFEKILAKAFATAEASASELTDVTATTLVSVRVDKIHQAAAKPFADVKADVLKKWTSDQKTERNLLATQGKVDELNTSDAGKDSAAAFAALKPVTIKALTRKGDASVPKDILPNIMSAEKGKFVMIASRDKDGLYIARVQTVSLPSANDAKADSKAGDFSKQVAADLSSSGLMGYMGYLQNKYPVTINDNLLKKVYGTPKDTAQ